MKITPAMLAKYGYTDNCEGCRYKEAGFDDSRNHTEACRARIEKALDGDEHGRRYKAEQDLRINRRMAEQFEAAADPAENGERVQAHTPTAPGEGGVSTPPAPVDAESDGGMNHEDAGLGSGASGSGFNPGPPKSAEKPTGAAGSGEKPTGAAGGPLPRQTPTYGQVDRGTSCRARSRTPGKHRGTLSPSRALSSNTRRAGLSPGAVDESQVRGDQPQVRGGSGISQEPTSRRSRSRERERLPAQQQAENVPVPSSPVVDVHFTLSLIHI